MRTFPGANSFDQSMVETKCGSQTENDFCTVVPFKFYVKIVLTVSPDLDNCSVLSKH